MGQPYTEKPADIFDPTVNATDWLELIDSGPSPSEAAFSSDSQQASVVGYIPWNKQRSAIAYFLGFAQVNSNFTLHRANPEQHGVFPQLFASEIGLKPFNPTVNPANPSAPLQFVSPWAGNQLVTLNSAFHKLAVCTVTYRTFRYRFLDDTVITDPRMEWMRNVYLDLDPKVEALSADGISQLAWVETSDRVAGPPTIPAGPTVNTKFPAPLSVLLGKNRYTLNWLSVPFEYLSASTNIFNPTNILNCLGKVNSSTFPYGSSNPFPAGTLLMNGVKFVQKVFPVASADPTSPLISVDVSIDLEYFNPPQGASSPISAGHNTMPWRQNGLFYYATRVDSGGSPPAATVDTPPLLASTDFNQMFVSPNG